MRAVLLIEEDTLIRELMREHLEREGYVTCAVATARIALSASRWTRFGLILLDFASASSCTQQELSTLRGLGAPVVMMRSAPAGTVIGIQGAVEQVVWSPFDLSTLTLAVRRFLPDAVVKPSADPNGPTVTQSGTYAAGTGSGAGEVPTIPAPGTESANGYSLDALRALVLEATDGRKVG